MSLLIDTLHVSFSGYLPWETMCIFIRQNMIVTAAAAFSNTAAAAVAEKNANRLHYLGR